MPMGVICGVGYLKEYEIPEQFFTIIESYLLKKFNSPHNSGINKFFVIE